jgi:hypothetical protein
LALHPALYFYNASGGFQPNSFLSIIVLFKQWDTKQFPEFTEVRTTFEAFLLNNRRTTEAIRKLGSGGRSRPRLVALYGRVIQEARNGKSAEEITTKLAGELEFSFLATEPTNNIKSSRPGQKWRPSRGRVNKKPRRGARRVAMRPLRMFVRLARRKNTSVDNQKRLWILTLFTARIIMSNG